MSQLVFPLLMMGLIYFLVILPQRKRVRAQQALLSALAPGDRVLTTAGIYGTIVALEGDIVHVNVAPGVELRFAKGAIARRLEPAAGDAPSNRPEEQA